ncbi:MAG: phage head closure protein [Eubacteriales bacterium]|nr:phage head closure protein [Eubacteriales bacterium]
MNPGKYRHEITFLQQGTGQDDYGEPTDTWGTFTIAWAAFDPLLGNEFFSALSVESKVEVKFNSRYVAGVTNDMRIQHGGKTYEILSAINVKGLNRELLCYCREVK